MGGVKYCVGRGLQHQSPRGLVQVTDFPERLDRVTLLLRYHDRQVQLTSGHPRGGAERCGRETLDWSAVAQGPVAEGVAPRPSVVGLRVAEASRSCSRRLPSKAALSPWPRRGLALNNEPASRADGGRSAHRTPGDRPPGRRHARGAHRRTSANNVVTLSLSPIVTLQDADSGNGPPAVTAIRRNGHHRARRRRRDAGPRRIHPSARERASGRMPAPAGWLRPSTVVTRKRIELVIALTPRMSLGPIGAPSCTSGSYGLAKASA